MGGCDRGEEPWAESNAVFDLNRNFLSHLTPFFIFISIYLVFILINIIKFI